MGEYLFSLRLDGLRTTLARTSAATLLRLPRLGHGRHFFNPLDLMIYGFNPVLSAYGTPGTVWHSGNAYDFKQWGVTGTTSVLGVRRVHVPAGTFRWFCLCSDYVVLPSKVPARTWTRWTPTTVVVPVTPNCLRSNTLPLCQAAPGVP